MADDDLSESQRRLREIGERLKSLEVGDEIVASGHTFDDDYEGTVVEKENRPNGDETYLAYVDVEGEDSRLVLRANWRDIIPDDDDQETPYTSFVFEPWDDTAHYITKLEVKG